MVNASILIAVNDENVVHELHERLVKLGYRVSGFAASHEETIAKIEQCNPDLILTDLQFNGKRGGIRTGALIHRIFNKPVIYITGSLGQLTVQRAKSTGPFGYIIKPFDSMQIYAMIETALLRHQLEAELRGERRWLNAVLNGINDGVIALDEHGQISFINPIAKQLTGRSEAEFLNKPIEEVFAFFDEASHKKLNILNLPLNSKRRNADGRIEGLLLSTNGTTTPVEAEISLFNDESGQIAGMVLVFRDIKKRREAFLEIQRQSQRAEALVETASRLNALLELEPVLETISIICNQAFHASGTAVFLDDPAQRSFHMEAAETELPGLSSYKDIPDKFPGRLLESFVSEDKPVTFISDIQSYPNLPYSEFFSEHNIHTVGLAGMYRQHALIGSLILFFSGFPIHLPEDAPTLLKGLAGQATISITNASLFEQVRKGREYQKALTTRLVEVQETERRHIAMELHDQIGQVLTGLQFMLESGKKPADEDWPGKINEAQATVSGLIEQIREMSLNLRPSMLDDLGLLPTLQWHFERYTKQTGIKITFNPIGIDQRLSPDVETAVYRIIQEALTNIARHAKVSEAFVNLSLKDNKLGIAIIDCGIGFEPGFDINKTTTSGLTSMRERANMLGGYLEAKSTPNKGTQILVMLPLENKLLERRNRVRNPDSG